MKETTANVLSAQIKPNKKHTAVSKLLLSPFINAREIYWVRATRASETFQYLIATMLHKLGSIYVTASC